MTMLRTLGQTSLPDALTIEQKYLLDSLIQLHWDPVPEIWKRNVTTAQLEELIAGMMLSYSTDFPDAPANVAIHYLMTQIQPYEEPDDGDDCPDSKPCCCGCGSSFTRIELSQAESNALKMYADGYYVATPESQGGGDAPAWEESTW